MTAPSPLDLERAVYASNPVAWFEIYGRIEDKHVGSDPDKAPVANYLQRAVGEAVQWCLANGKPVRMLLYKPRQKGCSTISVEVLYVLSRFVKMKIMIIGGQASQTDNLWKILRYYGENDTFDWGNAWTLNEERARCTNGTLWERETAGDPEAGRSGNYHACLMTEVARWPTDGKKNAGDVLTSVTNTVGNNPGTVIILESTANGPVGVFPTTWEGAVRLDEARAGRFGNGYIKIFAPWYQFEECSKALEPGDETTLLMRVEKSGDVKALRVFHQYHLTLPQLKWYHEILDAPECSGDPVRRDREYPTSEEDGFAASSPSRFDLAALERLDGYASARARDLRYGMLENPSRVPQFYRDVIFRPTSEMEAEICVLEPPHPEMRYLVSTDNSRGVSFVDGGDTDCHGVVVIRLGYYGDRGWVRDEIVCALMPETRWDQDVLAETVARLAGWYGGCTVVPEANRGELLIKCLRDKGVMIYQRERKKAEIDSYKDSGLFGFETTEETKRYVIENLASMLRDQDRPGTGIGIAFPWVLRELRTFVRFKDGKEGALKVAGCHDDFVMAVAIAAAHRSAATLYVPAGPRSGFRDIGLPADTAKRGVW